MSSWLFFNVAIALLLMELGIYKLLEETLGIFSIISAAWLCSISADLFINKPLGLAPPGIEFKRAHLYDINPVGVGGMTINATIALAAHFGLFGSYAASLAIYMTPVVAAIAGARHRLGDEGQILSRAQAAPAVEEPHQHHLLDLRTSVRAGRHGLVPGLCRANLFLVLLARQPLPRSLQAQGPGSNIRRPRWRKPFCPNRRSGRCRAGWGRYGMTTALAIGLIGLVLWGIAERAGTVLPEAAVAVGTTVWIVFLVFSILTGIATWFFVLAHDSRVVAEEESSRQNTLLLKEIAAHKKTDAALQYAKETAESANRAKSRYVVGLTHELRTPLNAVLGYAQLLDRDESIPDTRRSAIRVIKRSADHLSGLIDGLLDISKIEAGRLQVFSDEINIRDFLDQVIGMMRPQAEAKGLVFDVSIDPKLPHYVRTDEKRLRQILVNLLSNAIKYTSDGTVSLTLAYRGQVATFTIVDTGPGIPEADLPVIFEPFQRGSGQQAQLAPGLGLGLTITRLLTQTLGGEITVESEQGRGTTFRVRLMLYGLSKPGGPALDRKILTYTGPRRTIVVVDDNEEHRELMREALTPLDFVVLTAISGPDCLALIEGARPDIFLVDISMPGMNGWELAAKLREGGRTAPIVMLSANIGDGGAGAISGSDHNDTLAKPVNFRQLHDKLATWLGLEWVYATVPTAAAATKAEPELRSPGAGHIDELIRLGEIGYVRGIKAKLAELAKTAENRHFAEVMTAHIKAFNIDAYLADLRKLEREGAET